MDRFVHQSVIWCLSESCVSCSTVDIVTSLETSVLLYLLRFRINFFLLWDVFDLFTAITLSQIIFYIEIGLTFRYSCWTKQSFIHLFFASSSGISISMGLNFILFLRFFCSRTFSMVKPNADLNTAICIWNQWYMNSL